MLVLEPGATPEAVVRDANQQLQDHQRVRSFSVWTGGELPRTEGTRKLKRQAIRDWVASGAQARGGVDGDDPVAALLARLPAGARSTPTRRSRISG